MNEDVIYEPIVRHIDISDYLRTFLKIVSQKDSRPVKITNDSDAFRIRALMNIPNNTAFKSISDIASGQPYWKYQEVDYVPSNLGTGRGYIFYFICRRCARRVKYLYFTSDLDPPECRKCCRLSYYRPSHKHRVKRLSDK